MHTDTQPTPDDIMAAVGHLASSFAILEFEVVDCLSLMVNDSNLKIGETICNRQPFTQTLTLIADLAKGQIPEQGTREFKALSKKLREAALFRNDILHSSWAFPLEGEPGHVFQQRARRRDSNPSSYDPHQLMSRLNDASKRMWDLYNEVIDFKKEYLC